MNKPAPVPTLRAFMEEAVDKTDVTSKIPYWKQILNQAPAQNKYELGVIATIEKKNGMATARQIAVIQRAVNGDKSKPYSSKN